MNLALDILWKPISGTRYEVSNCGGVRRGGRRIKGWLNERGYRRISIRIDDKQYQRFLHHLVAEAFIGPRPEWTVLNHIDGDKGNNSAWNLEYISPKQNVEHATALGLYPKGEDNPYSRLTESQVVKILRILKGPHNKSEMSRQFRITRQTIRLIERGKRWAYLQSA